MIRRAWRRIVSWIVAASTVADDLSILTDSVTDWEATATKRSLAIETQLADLQAKLTAFRTVTDTRGSHILTILTDQEAHATAHSRRLTQHELRLDQLDASVRQRERDEQRETWFRRLAGFTAEQRPVLERVTAALEHPAWPDAQQAVRSVATTLGFSNQEAWLPYSRALKADPGQSENVFRHLKAVHEVKVSLAARGHPLSNPLVNLLIELGYQGFDAMQ